VTERTNDKWLADLRSTGAVREAALADLHGILNDGLARGLLGRVDTSAPEFSTLAEDFVQEALLKILDNLDTFAGRSKFTTWAHKITVHIALTELRRKRWKDSSLDQLTEREEGEYTPRYTADPAPAPENSLERNDMLARVNRIIEEELTEKQRTIMKSAVFQEQPAAVVAKNMDMNPNAVYKLLHDARLRLKQRLEKEGLTPADVLSVFDD
jgi:RNA polymerase sigma-70 factor, ECF subfamily